MAVKKSKSSNQKRKQTPQNSKKSKAVKKIVNNNPVIGLVLIAIGLFSAYAYIFGGGVVGNLVRQGFIYFFGVPILFVSLYLFILGILFLTNKIKDWTQNFFLIAILLINSMIAFSINIPDFSFYSVWDLFSLAQYGQYGGIIGILLAALFIKLFSSSGTVLIILISSIIILMIIFKNSLNKYWLYIKEKNKNGPSIKERISEKIEIAKDKSRIKKEVKATKTRTSETTMIPPVSDLIKEGSLFESLKINEDQAFVEQLERNEKKSLFEPVMKKEEIPKKKRSGDPFGFIEDEVETKMGEPLKIHENFLNPIEPMTRETNSKKNNDKNNDKDEIKQTDLEDIKIEEKAEEYVFPSMNLLNPPAVKKKSKKDDVLKKAKIIEETLKNFGVKAKIIEVNVGPSITRFELQLDPGVKVNKFVNLSNDLALSLATSDIRIEAPIPGKAAVGIEVPNDVSEIVGLREIIDTPQFENSKSHLTFALGKTLSGENVIGDIGKMPHMLIAGATGSGKSVCINSIIVSLIFKSSPDDVRFIMIDPKMVELSQYNAIPHLLIPVVTDPKKASYALNWGLKEMTERYMLFKDNNVRDIEGYNQLMKTNGEKKLPRIVIVIDELADLMITSPKECENAICRIAQLARACGIHLVIATQRPSVDVITGLIKANIPSRIAFSVASNTDSRTILDTGGAEKLLGKGDMLYYPVGQSKPTRVQCTYVSDSEINAVIDAVTVKQGQQYDPSIEEAILKEPETKSKTRQGDALTDDALTIGFEYNQLSTSMLQRKLQVGYARAGRIIDDLEERGIISGPNGSKPRQLLVSEDEYRNREAGEK